MKILVYAEKLSDGIEIAKNLSVNNEISICNWKAICKWYDWNDITVFWWIGHFYLLKTPIELGIDFNLKVLPIFPKQIEFKIDKSLDNKEVLRNNAVDLLKSENYDLLVFAWDATKEWLIILDRLYKMSWSSIPIEYIWRGDNSKREIRTLWKNRLKWSDKLISWEIINWLIESANQRCIADWKFWMNFSQLYTLYYKIIKSGSVKLWIWRLLLPTLNIIANREDEINTFISKKFFKIKVDFKEWFSWIYFEDIDNDERSNMYDNTIIEKLWLNIINHKQWIIDNLEIKYIKKNPLFGLNCSNINLSRKLQITPKKILDLIYEMYYIDWVMSYPKVESYHVTCEEYENIKNTILFLYKYIHLIPDKYREVLNYIIKNDFKTTIPIVNDKKIIEWHWAFHIKITKEKLSENNIIKLINGSDNKSKIFIKILNNNLQFFLPKAINKTYKIITNINNNSFVTKECFLYKKWFKVLDDVELWIPPYYLEKIIEWDIININKYTEEEWKTIPPIRINTDNILLYMKHPNIFLNSYNSEIEEDLFNITEKSEWIWHPSKNQKIIENIINAKYVNLINWDLFITELWKNILNIVDIKVKDLIISANIEKILNDIAYNNNIQDIAWSEINNFIKNIVENKIDKNFIEKYEDLIKINKILIDSKSPEWYNLYLKDNKKWTYYVTSDDNLWENWYPIFYSIFDPIKKMFVNNDFICDTNEKCPQCNNNMKIFKSPKNDKYYIECKNRKSWLCDFVSLYDINNDKIIQYECNYIENIKCENCWWKLLLKKSLKDWNYYAICNQTYEKWECNFIKQYDRNTKKLMLPIYMRNSKPIWIKFKWKELYENNKSYFSLDWEITFWKKIWWIDISFDIIMELIEKWKTKNIIKGFTSQKGTTFSARLKLSWNKIWYDF